MSDPQTEPTLSSKKETSARKSRRTSRRYERRFVAQSPYSSWLVTTVSGLGAAVMGAGAWSYVYGESFKKAAEVAAAASDASPQSFFRVEAVPSYILAAGAALTGLGIWIGTSSETPLRVGAPGIAMERGEIRRMAWSGVSKIAWEAAALALLVEGDDETGQAWTFRVPVKSHAEAVGWILREALDRVPGVVDIDKDVLDQMPRANPHAGEKLDLEPLQVVGKRDALTQKIISYEPEARVCTRCERIYDKKSVPETCKCGASLLALRTSEAAEGDPNQEERA